MVLLKLGQHPLHVTDPVLKVAPHPKEGNVPHQQVANDLLLKNHAVALPRSIPGVVVGNVSLAQKYQVVAGRAMVS